MPAAADLRVLMALLRGIGGSGAHAQRLQRFYAPQASRYDDFRDRLLIGRRELVEMLPLAAGDVFVELGGGTGRNLDFLGSRIDLLAGVEVVDLCPALLSVARKRAAGRPNVRIVEADATTYRPAAAVDCVLYSYAITMIPDWKTAIDNAVSILRPGGVLAAVDFYISQARPQPGRVRHGTLARAFWPLWFRHDGVRLSSDHLPYLCSRLRTLHLSEHFSAVPYLPLASVPYYLYLGLKR